MASFPTSSASARGDGHIVPVPVISSPRLRTLGPGPTVLVVGYPAPAAVHIVDRLLATDARTIACVVSQAEWVHASEMHRSAQTSGRIRLFEGTADAPGLGLACTAWRILDTTDEIYAAAPADSIARGHLHDFADECPWLRNLHLLEEAPEGPTPPSTSRRSRLRRFLPSRSTLSKRFSPRHR